MSTRLYAIDRMILLLAATGMLIYGTNRLARPATSPLTRLDPGTVHEIRLLRGDELRLDLLRDANGWMITHPGITRTRSRRVGQLLALLRTHSYRSWPVSEELLAQAGLDKPARRLLFDHLEIDFGGPSTPPGQRYVRVGKRIHLVDELWLGISGLPASHFREVP